MLIVYTLRSRVPPFLAQERRDCLGLSLSRGFSLHGIAAAVLRWLVMVAYQARMECNVIDAAAAVEEAGYFVF